MHNRNHKKGFTLIELLVVIAIISILAVVVVLTLNPAELLRQSRDSQRVSDLGTLKSAISLYLVDAAYPNLASSTTGGYAACYLSTISGKGTTTTTPACGVFTKTYASGNSSATALLYRNNNAVVAGQLFPDHLWVAAQRAARRSDQQRQLLLCIRGDFQRRQLFPDRCVHGEQEI